MADVQEEVGVIAQTVNRIERRLDAAHIPELPDDGEDLGPWLPPFRPPST